MAPNISIREYIRWLPDPVHEPTSTIVLTSSENRFVDIRILKSTNDPRENESINEVIHTSQVDWAFAGVSTTAIKPDKQGLAIVHSKWHHWVDSRAEDAESVIDEGDMFPQPDGTTLELGSMVNPATGKETEYEESWSDIEPVSTETDVAQGSGKKVCIVLQLHDDANKARGVVVRLGQFCQGVLRVGQHVTLERWRWRSESGWRREVRAGDLFLPCGITFEVERLTMGGEIKYGENVWNVVELNGF